MTATPTVTARESRQGSAGGRPKATPSSRRMLAALSLSMLSASLGASIASVGLPALADAFGAPFQGVQWIVLAYLLALTALIVSAGRLGDMVGRRRLLLAGIAVFVIASVLCAAAPSLWALIVARAAQGLGAAAMIAMTLAAVADAVSKERAGSVMGLLGTMSAIGSALGPLLGGALIEIGGWPAIFLPCALLGIVAFGLAARSLPQDRRVPASARFDAPGAALLALALVAYALVMTPGRGGFGARDAALLCAGIVSIALFIRVEARMAAPLIPLALFRNAAFNASLAMNALVSTVIMATLVVGPFYLSQGLGLTAGEAGLALSTGPVVSVLSGVVAGRIVDRLGARSATVIGLAVMAAGTVALAILPPVTGVAGYVAAVAIVSPGYQLFQAANNTAVMMDVAADRRGVVSGVLGLSRNLGLVTGASALGALFALATGVVPVTAASPAAVATGLEVTFGAATGLLLVALAAGFLGRRAPAAAALAGDRP